MLLKAVCGYNKIMKELMLFTAVEFVDDPNVIGNYYWYLCEFNNACVGDYVIAPLGSHNREQQGIIRRTMRADEYNSPFPFAYIKKIRRLINNQR